ncbi:MAG: hypothetical protein VB858_17400 [Planctomycetaceae bacterium]
MLLLQEQWKLARVACRLLIGHYETQREIPDGHPVAPVTTTCRNYAGTGQAQSLVVDSTIAERTHTRRTVRLGPCADHAAETGAAGGLTAADAGYFRATPPQDD